MKQTLSKWLPMAYICCMAAVMMGYAQYGPYQIDGDAVSYTDIAEAMVRGRWREVVNGLWNPGYPAVLALGKVLIHPNRMRELQLFYWVNYCIFLVSIVCTWFFVGSVLRVRAACVSADDTWGLPDHLLYVVSYAAVFLSWQHEFSLGRIQVDALFATLLLLAFAFLLRSIFTPRPAFNLAFGFCLGLAYLVKSPGFVIAIVTFVLLAIYAAVTGHVRDCRWRLLVSAVIFILVAGPYITALSIQKGRVDFGDSARLNYAWLVGGTAPQHLLNNQPARFDNATVHLKHSEIEILQHPVVVYFPHFPHATYGPWFDPSYFNDGIRPRVDLGRQWRLTIQQSRHLMLFLLIHALPIAFLVFCMVCGAKVTSVHAARWILWLLYAVMLFSFAMYLAVHFLDRYVGAQFWIVWIATAGLLVANQPMRKHLIQGAAAFLAIAVLFAGLQSVAQYRQAVILNGLGHGWYNPAEFQTAGALRADGIAPGDAVACFRACNHGSYWAYLAGLHVNSEVYDPTLMPDAGSSNEIWSKLPNKQQVLEALQSIGARALVGYFEDTPPDGEKWRPLAGGYYMIPLPVKRAPSPPLKPHGK